MKQQHRTALTRFGHVGAQAAGIDPAVLDAVEPRRFANGASARRRSSTKSSAASTPQERPTRSAGTAAAAGQLEGRKFAERTRRGLATARAKGASAGRPSVADQPDLRERIASMRSEGQTLQAIADTLHTDGVPTLRGGIHWRPSSVQAAAGYKRPRRLRGLEDLPGCHGLRPTGS